MLVLDSGDKIQGDASAATVVDYTFHGLDNSALKQLADGQLGITTGDLYTADSVDVIATITIVNTDTVTRTINLFLLPSAGTARRLIPKDLALDAGYSLFFDGAKCTVMDTNGNIANGTLGVSDTAYDEASWNGVTTLAPSKNAVRDEFEVKAAIINALDSPCIVTGGEIITGTNAGTFKVAAITEAYLRATASATGTLTSVTLAEQDNQAITAANTTYYVIFTYGSPCTITISESAPNNQNAIAIGKVRKDSADEVHYISSGLRLGNAAFKAHQRARTLREIDLQSGSAIAYSGTNNFTMGTGIVYAGLNRLSLASYDSAVTTFTPVYTGFVEGNKLSGTDIAFVDGGTGEDTITRTAADFLTNGYVAGDVLTVAGSTNNDGSYDIISVIADTINVATGSLVAEAAGASVTLTIAKKKIDFEHYDNAGALGEIGNNRYGVHYVYKHIDDDHVYVRYGAGSYTLAEAEAYAVELPSIPTHLSDFGCLIGSIIAPKAGGSFTKIVMVTSQFFSGTEATNHVNLSNLAYADSGHTGFATSAQGALADSALQNVAEDTTPQLGGNLDVNGKTITSASDGDITLQPNGTGQTIVYAPSTVVTSKTTTATLTVAEAGTILVSASAAYTITLPTASGNAGLTYDFVKTDFNYNLITLAANGTETFNYPNDDGTTKTTYPRLNTGGAKATVVSDGSNWIVTKEDLGQVPEARAYLSSNQLDLTDATVTKVLLNAENYDIGNNFDTTNGKFVCPISGRYLIINQVSYVNAVADMSGQSRLHKNGSEISSVVSHTGSGGEGILVAEVLDFFILNKNDYLESNAYVECGVNTVDIQGTSVRTYMLVKLISKD